MIPVLAPHIVRKAFLAACHDELQALKPGNVHTFAAGHGMQVWHFERSAEASAPFIADAALKVGARIRGAMAASFAIAGCNTNLGILLLAAPLARAADTPVPGRDLRARLGVVLDALDLEDAEETFWAIRLANPAGLGRVDVADVNEPPPMTLREAMAVAAHRDRISRAYVTRYEEIFTLALPHFDAAQQAGATQAEATTAVHMLLLSAFPDSHIARKHGAATATEVREQAERLAELSRPYPKSATMPQLLAFDADLKRRGINPGTTADLVVATLFAHQLRAHLECASSS